MGATNETLNYHLSQFISTDKPAWLQDYNGDMTKIDSGINAAKVAADSAQNTADGAVTSIGTVSDDVSALQTTVGGHTTDITDLQGDVNTIESLIGNGTPTTTDHTIIGAINEINAELNEIDELTFIGSYSTDTDGVNIALNSYKKLYVELEIGAITYITSYVPVSLFKAHGRPFGIYYTDSQRALVYYVNDTTVNVKVIAGLTLKLYGVK